MPDKQACDLLLSIALDHNLDQLNYKPNRKNSILELAFSSCPELVTSCTTGPGISDHEHILLLRANIRAKQSKKKPRIIHLFKKADWESVKWFLKAAEDTFFQNSPDANSVERNWNFFKDTITEAINKFIPKKKASGRFNLPWMMRTIKRQIRQKHRAYNRAKKKQGQWLGQLQEAAKEGPELPQDGPLGLSEQLVRGLQWRQQQRIEEVPQRNEEGHVWRGYSSCRWAYRHWPPG